MNNPINLDDLRAQAERYGDELVSAQEDLFSASVAYESGLGKDVTDEGVWKEVLNRRKTAEHQLDVARMRYSVAYDKFAREVTTASLEANAAALEDQSKNSALVLEANKLAVQINEKLLVAVGVLIERVGTAVGALDGTHPAPSLDEFRRLEGLKLALRYADTAATSAEIALDAGRYETFLKRGSDE